MMRCRKCLSYLFSIHRALGVLLFYLINREYPFHDNAAILETQYSFKVKFGPRCNYQPSPELENILSRTIDSNVETRISITELMKHPWFAAQVAAIEATVPKPKTPTENVANAADKTEASTSATSAPQQQTPSSQAGATTPTNSATPTEASNTASDTSDKVSSKTPTRRS